MKKAKFYICRTCGNLVGMVHSSGVPMMCCGKPMEALEPNTVEASGEKHLPAVTVEDGVVNVNIGSVDHPMIDVHYIEWVYLQTENGGQRISLKPGQAPAVKFLLGDEKPVAVYAYCNLHGLWMTEL
ncbi:MAG: desulfoferrodoxin [Lachnospiraceae bacterium]|nr:desulfoferrodoxin [Lachnospiraceae bacterium]